MVDGAANTIISLFSVGRRTETEIMLLRRLGEHSSKHLPAALAQYSCSTAAESHHRCRRHRHSGGRGRAASPAHARVPARSPAGRRRRRRRLGRARQELHRGDTDRLGIRRRIDDSAKARCAADSDSSSHGVTATRVNSVVAPDHRAWVQALFLRVGASECRLTGHVQVVAVRPHRALRVGPL